MLNKTIITLPIFPLLFLVHKSFYPSEEHLVYIALIYSSHAYVKGSLNLMSLVKTLSLLLNKISSFTQLLPEIVYFTEFFTYSLSLSLPTATFLKHTKN